MSAAENLEKLLSSISDSVTLELMTDPYVIPACQHTFDKSTLENIAAQNPSNATCPACRMPYEVSDLQPNYSMRDVIASTTPLIDKLRNDIQLDEINQAAKALKISDAKTPAPAPVSETPSRAAPATEAVLPLFTNT